jgi:hypothetical protein
MTIGGGGSGGRVMGHDWSFGDKLYKPEVKVVTKGPVVRSKDRNVSEGVQRQ